MTTTLKLIDDVEEISFINDASFKLVDSTFEADIPSKKETRTNLVFSSGRDLIDTAYNNRIIRFRFFVIGSDDISIHSNITKVTRMLIRSQNPVYMNGGGYVNNVKISEIINNVPTYVEGKNTGDNGLILRYKLSPNTPSGTIKNELGANVTPSGILTFRIITGDLKVLKSFSTARKVQIDGAYKFYAECEITLEAEPFALGEARVIAERSSAAYFEGVTLSSPNRFIVPASSVPGDAPALTRIYTSMVYSQKPGITIARDAGVSLLNSCTPPIVSQNISGEVNPPSPPLSSYNLKNDFTAWADVENNDVMAYRVRVTKTDQIPNQYSVTRFSWNGSGWTSASITSDQNMIAGVPFKLDANSEIYGLFYSNFGHTLNNEWWVEFLHSVLPTDVGVKNAAVRMARGQYSQINTRLPITVTLNTQTPASVPANQIFSPEGYYIGSAYFNVPPGCKSKYRIIANVVGSVNLLPSTLELMSTVSFALPVVSSTIYVTRNEQSTITDISALSTQTEATTSDWVLLEGNVVQLGVLDFSPNSAGFTGHHGANSFGVINFRLRAVSNIKTNATFTIERVLLIPCQDDDSYLDAAWTYTGSGYQVYCNYDYSNSYIAHSNSCYFDSGYNGISQTLGLDATYSGAPVTLIPNVKNTIIFYAREGTNGNWRDYQYKESASTGKTSLAIRPRYLFGG